MALAPHCQIWGTVTQLHLGPGHGPPGSDTETGPWLPQLRSLCFLGQAASVAGGGDDSRSSQLRGGRGCCSSGPGRAGWTPEVVGLSCDQDQLLVPTSLSTSQGSEVTLRPPRASLFPLCPMAFWLPSACLLHLRACLPASWWCAQRRQGRGPATQGAAEVNPLSETALVCRPARGSSLQRHVQGGPGESPSHSRVDFDQGGQWGSVTLRASGQPGQGTRRPA